MGLAETAHQALPAGEYAMRLVPRWGLRWGGAAILGAWAAASPARARDVPFTAAQAAHGEAIYTQVCAACHGAHLAGGNAPALIGPGFASHWARPAHSVSDLLTYVRVNMPLNAAGSLSSGDAAAVLAFVLAQNGFHAGERPLAASDAALKTAGLHGGATASPLAATANFVTGPNGAAPSGSGPAQAALVDAAKDGADWLSANRDYAGTRFSPLAQIDVTNVARLQKTCSFPIGGAAPLQTSPVAYHGVLYFTSGASTFAIGGADCTLRWRHDWPVSPTSDARIVNRGLALKDGRVLRFTEDGFLLALDSTNGVLLWARRVSDPSKGEFVTMPPLAYDDLVFAGPAVSEFGVRGWIAAFHIADGTQAWRFNTVPHKGEPGAETWAQDAGVKLGGGTIWTAISLDPATETLFVSAGNPAPDLAVDMRGGANLYTNSVIALHLRTGKLAWYDQIVPRDDHDWDINHAGPLYRATIGGQSHDLIATAGKDGMLRVLDRATRKIMFTAKLTTISNETAPVTTKGGDVCPGVLGGVQWNGPAYMPPAHLLVTPAVDWCSRYTLDAKVTFVPSQFYMGGAVTMKSDASGWLTAIDATTGALKWKLHSPRPMVAAVTPTAGGVIFAGELTGDLLALDAASGAVLNRLPVGGPLGGGIVTYEAGGKQYVAAVSGTPSGFWGSPKAPPGGPAITIFGTIFGMNAKP
jgi:alcohol dehydrogenase (cytochrome c)